MKVSELQHRPAVMCTPGTTIRNAVELMDEHNVGSVLVMDEHGAIRGIVTDRDVAIMGFLGNLGPDAKVSEIMTRAVQYVFENADVFTAIDQMAAGGCRRIPVLDEHGSPTGVIALDDIIMFFAEQAAKLGTTIRKEIGAGVFAA